MLLICRPSPRGLISVGLMATRKPQGKEPVADPGALREGVELLKEFQPMLEIILRKDLTEEERGLLIRKRFPPEVILPLRDRINAVRAALPAKKSPTEREGK